MKVVQDKANKMYSQIKDFRTALLTEDFKILDRFLIIKEGLQNMWIWRC